MKNLIKLQQSTSSLVQSLGSYAEFVSAVEAAYAEDFSFTHVDTTDEVVMLNSNDNKYIRFRFMADKKEVSAFFINTGRSVSVGDDVKDLSFGIYDLDEGKAILATVPPESAL